MNRRGFFKTVTSFVAGLIFAPKVEEEFTRSQTDEKWHFLGGDKVKLYIDGKEVV